MIVRRLAIACILTAAASSCGDEPDGYPDYAQTETGLRYKILALGEGDRKPEKGSTLTLAIAYRTESDSVFFSDEVTMPLSDPSFTGSFEEGLYTMNEGDSVSYIVSADSVFLRIMGDSVPPYVGKGRMLRVDIRLLVIHRDRDIEREARAYAEWLDTADLDELEAIGSYLSANNLKVKPTEGGLFIIEQTKGSGRRAAADKRVTVQYEGRFLDGTVFDSSHNRAAPHDFRLGDEKQVIPGIELALERMSEGEKMKLLLPSFLAYGKDGSSTGIVPPFTPVIYVIELIKVY